MYVLSWRTVSAPTRGLFWYLFPKLQSNKGNKHQNNTQVSAETVCHESTYNILFLTWHNESINDDKNDDLYTSSPCLTCSVFVLLMTSQSFPDDITITRQLWCDHMNSDMKWVRYQFYSWRYKLQWNFNQNKKLFIYENASEYIVCKMAAILSRGRWVKNLPSHRKKGAYFNLAEWTLSVSVYEMATADTNFVFILQESWLL